MADTNIADLEKRLTMIEGALARFPYPPVDPPPDDFPRWRGGWPWSRPVPIPFPWPEPGDPSPIDVSRFSKAQLQLALETIKAQRTRLDGLEQVIQTQLKGVR